MNKNREFIDIEGEIYEIGDPNDGYEKNIAYTHDESVYIYRGKLKKDKELLPGSIYKGEDGKPLYVQPDNLEIYSTDRIISANFDEMNKGEVKEIDPILIESSSEYFAPKFDESDNILKRMIKEVLQKKKISLRYSSEYRSEYDITNLKSQILKPSAMSINYFLKWCDILDLDLTIDLKFLDADGNFVDISKKNDYSPTQGLEKETDENEDDDIE